VTVPAFQTVFVFTSKRLSAIQVCSEFCVEKPYCSQPVGYTITIPILTDVTQSKMDQKINVKIDQYLGFLTALPISRRISFFLAYRKF